MEELNGLYQAFREYQDKVLDDSWHEDWIRAIRDASTGMDIYQDHCTTLLWDHEWIDAFEYAFPYIEKALEEQRRFIESFSEIRRVDQARKTTVDSVRHLAEHSNFINRVEDGAVIPDKLLIVQREDNYAIYENRFLFTLIQQMEQFIQVRYRAAKENSGMRQITARFHRDGQVARTKLRSEISFTLEQMPDTQATGEAYEGMSDTERVELLALRTGQLASAPLMRELKGCRPVTVPIVRTNVFKNNENFKQALNLFDFLQRYQKTGYEIVSDQQNDSALPENLRSWLCEIVTLETMMGRLTMNPGEEEGLAEEYALSQEKLRLQEKEKEIRVHQALRSQAVQIRREEQALREREIAIREEIIEKKDEEIARQQAEIAACDHQLKHIEKEKEQIADQLAKTDELNQRLEKTLEDVREEAKQALVRETEERRLRREDLERAKEEILQARKEAEDAAALRISAAERSIREADEQVKEAKTRQTAAERSEMELRRQVRELQEKNNHLQKRLTQARRTIQKHEKKTEPVNLGHQVRKIWNGGQE